MVKSGTEYDFLDEEVENVCKNCLGTGELVELTLEPTEQGVVKRLIPKSCTCKRSKKK